MAAALRSLGLGLALGLVGASPARAHALPPSEGRQPGEPPTWYDEAEPGPLVATQGALDARRLADRPALDLLLERPLDLLSGQTPWLQLTGPGGGAAAVDPRAFAPEFPAHPMFPGVGLSFEPSPAALRPAKAAPERGWPPGPAASAAERADLDALRETLGPERLRDLKRLRQWLLDNRVVGLWTLAAVALLVLGGVLVRRWLDMLQAREAARARRRRRRRSSRGGASGTP